MATAPARTRTSIDPRAVVGALRRALVDAATPVALHEPTFAGNERTYVDDCVVTGWVSSAGAYVDRFEAMIAEYLGVPRAVAVVNGTAALQVALRMVGVGPGDEVIVPSLTFVATANAVAYLGAVPHFADVSRATLGLDPDKLDEHLRAIVERRGDTPVNRATDRPIRAIVPMHAYGFPVDVEGLLAVAGRWGIPVVEDAAEALGSTYRGRPCGTLGRIAALSFNGNKIVTTGGGGALVSGDAALMARAKHLTTTAKRAHRWAYDHDELGYNFRMPNLNAALGCAQLEQLPGLLDAKAALAARYRDAFADVAGAALHGAAPDTSPNHWLNILVLDEPDIERRDAVLAAAHDAGYLARPAWEPMHRLPMYRAAPRMDLAVTEALDASIVCLPSSPKLGLPPRGA